MERTKQAEGQKRKNEDRWDDDWRNKPTLHHAPLLPWRRERGLSLSRRRTWRQWHRSV